MILKALCDYYNRSEGLPGYGMEEKEIGFIIVIDNCGNFLRIEDSRTGKDTARKYCVMKAVGRTSAPKANYLYDSCQYVVGYSPKNNGKEAICFDLFKAKVKEIEKRFPENDQLHALSLFYDKDRETIIEQVQKDPLWDDISKNLSKKYAVFSFLIEGDTEIIAQKKELMAFEESLDDGLQNGSEQICLIKGEHCVPVKITTATSIVGSQATAKLVAFQGSSGYDSYGKTQGSNAPISPEAEFEYTTALKIMLQKGSHNKFLIGNRTYLFWASSNDEASIKAEESFFSLMGYNDTDDPNANIEEVQRVFKAIYSGEIRCGLDDRFYILGLMPNSARIAVTYWSELSLREFAHKILMHFNDMEIIDTRKSKWPYAGLREMLSTVTLGGKQSDVTPNLPDAVAKSIFQGLPYPYSLFSSCIRRIRAEQKLGICRAAILKAYLNRIKSNNYKITVMLDKENTNPGYLCGRLFAVLDKIQEDANGIHSIQERYMNSASSTPSSVFATILNLSSHHSEKLTNGSRIFYEKIKQEIMDKLPSDGFPAHLDLQDQGRFFVGFYQQRQDFFKGKSEN